MERRISTASQCSHEQKGKYQERLRPLPLDSSTHEHLDAREIDGLRRSTARCKWKYTDRQEWVIRLAELAMATSMLQYIYRNCGDHAFLILPPSATSRRLHLAPFLLSSPTSGSAWSRPLQTARLSAEHQYALALAIQELLVLPTLSTPPASHILVRCSTPSNSIPQTHTFRSTVPRPESRNAGALIACRSV